MDTFLFCYSKSLYKLIGRNSNERQLTQQDISNKFITLCNILGDISKLLQLEMALFLTIKRHSDYKNMPNLNLMAFKKKVSESKLNFLSIFLKHS